MRGNELIADDEDDELLGEGESEEMKLGFTSIYLIIRMQASQTYHSVEHALDTICSRGGSLLYDAYIADKLPSHIHESTHEQLTRHLNLPFS